jgi:hypothetical protein
VRQRPLLKFGLTAEQSRFSYGVSRRKLAGEGSAHDLESQMTSNERLAVLE